MAPLVYTRDGEDFVVVGTNFRQPHHLAWTTNLLADPTATVQVGGERIGVAAELVDKETCGRLWPRFVSVSPVHEQYLARCAGRTPRVSVLRRAGGPVLTSPGATTGSWTPETKTPRTTPSPRGRCLS